MKAPAPTWTATYQHDRSHARHRCRCCNRILNAGDMVILARIGCNETLAIHDECGEKQHGTADWRWRDAMAYWGTEYLRAVGYRVELPPVPAAA